MKVRVIQGRDGKGIKLLRAILHFGAPPLLYSIPSEAVYAMEKLLEQGYG